jgi:hypothetical protein
MDIAGGAKVRPLEDSDDEDTPTEEICIDDLQRYSLEPMTRTRYARTLVR